jgi:TonB family protein
MISIAQLRTPGFSLHWHEAVAAVAEVATVLQARGFSRVPAPESFIIGPDGVLSLGAGPWEDPWDFEDSGDGLPVPRLGRMLDELLSSVACPSELRRLATESMADPPAHATVEAFAEALAFFERPGRRELLKAVAERSLEVDSQALANAELERLAARARDLQPKDDRRPEKTRSRSRRTVLFVAAAMVLLAVVASGVLALLAADSERATITGRVRTRVERIAKSGLEAIGMRAPEAPVQATSTPAVAAPRRVVRKTPRRPSRDLPVTVSVRELKGQGVVDPAFGETLESPEPLVSRETVYTAAEEGVEPAVLMRPHLPSRAPATVSHEDVGVLELVVSATGAVDHVRLISPANRYQDRMMVAAAKAWQFRPATKDGQPVRFRTRVRVTL